MVMPDGTPIAQGPEMYFHHSEDTIITACGQDTTSLAHPQKVVINGEVKWQVTSWTSTKVHVDCDECLKKLQEAE